VERQRQDDIVNLAPEKATAVRLAHQRKVEVHLQRVTAQKQKEAPSPIAIAREALRRLAVSRIAPTPDNYRRLYHEISGNAPQPANTGAVQPALEPAPDTPWHHLIRDLLRHWETRHGQLTLAKKREALERVLNNFAANPALLGVKLQSLIASWSGSSSGAQEKHYEPEAVPGTPAAAAPDSSVAPALKLTRTETAGPDTSSPTGWLRQILGQILETAAGLHLSAHPELAAEATALAQLARTADDSAGAAQFAARLKDFLLTLEHSGEDAAALHQGLTRLLQLLLKSMRDLVAGDPWLDGQIAVLENLVARPLNIKVIEEAERSLKNLALKQGVLKHSLDQVKHTLKDMVSRFIDRLGELSESTGDYHDKIAGYSEQISRTDDITELNRLLTEVMRETKLIQSSALSSRDNLVAARREVEAAQVQIRQLESSLAHVSAQVCEDQLTGALNRRGLDDGFEREASRADRHGLPLCMALLDVDNFKQLNDKYGHQAGDDALVYLTQVIKDTVRPDDCVARFGGEEFLILLPDTALDEALAVVARLQRAMTRQLFLHDNERMLITFSAGVAQRAAGESKETLIGRVDKALYDAKRAGKNRVMPAV